MVLKDCARYGQPPRPLQPLASVTVSDVPCVRQITHGCCLWMVHMVMPDVPVAIIRKTSIEMYST